MLLKKICQVCETNFLGLVQKVYCSQTCQRQKEKDKYAHDVEYRTKIQTRARERARSRGCKPRQQTPFTGLSTKERYHMDADFAQKIKDKIKKRYHTDPDFAKQVKERASKWVKNLYHTNPDYRTKALQACQDWKMANPEAIKSYQKNNHDTGHNTYQAILQRCNSPKRQCYKQYGGKGVRCLFATLEDFQKVYFRTNHCELCGIELQDVNRRLHNGRTIDRINSNGHYETDNCRILCCACNFLRPHLERFFQRPECDKGDHYEIKWRDGTTIIVPKS
jgi:hypothetical protein